MSAKTKKTEKGSGVVHFSVHGDYLTNLARERWIEDNPKAAVNFLMESLPGISQELTVGILTGKYKLEGINDLLLEEDNETELYSIPLSIQSRWDRLVPKFLQMLSELNSIKSRMLVLANTMTSKGADYRTGYGYDDGRSPFSLPNDKKRYIHLTNQIKPIQDDIQFVAELLGKKMSDIPYDEMPDYPSGVDTSNGYPEQKHTMKSLLESDGEEFEDEWLDLRRESRQTMILDSYMKAAKEIDEKLSKKIEPNPISDMNDAGWLAPNGDWYGLNGQIANMLHNQIADKLAEDGIVDTGDPDDNNPDGWMMSHGWIRIHNDNVLYDGYMNRLYLQKPNVPVTKAQREQLVKYAQLQPKGYLTFGFHKKAVSGAKLEWLEDEELEKLFDL